MPYDECVRVINAAKEDDSEVYFDCLEGVKIHVFHGSDIGALCHVPDDEKKIVRPPAIVH